MCLDSPYQQTEEIGLQKITTTKIFDKFSLGAVYISHTFIRMTSNFLTSRLVREQSPHHSKDLLGNRVDLEIQIFEVGSQPWMDLQWVIAPSETIVDVDFWNGFSKTDLLSIKCCLGVFVFSRNSFRPSLTKNLDTTNNKTWLARREARERDN